MLAMVDNSSRKKFDEFIAEFITLEIFINDCGIHHARISKFSTTWTIYCSAHSGDKRII